MWVSSAAAGAEVVVVVVVVAVGSAGPSTGPRGHADAQGPHVRHLTPFPAAQDLDERQLCEPGEVCATRKGSRIGKLCDCFLPRTTEAACSGLRMRPKDSGGWALCFGGSASSDH
ncbi:hypothetical protein CRUP_010984 [Coryphaenoides rupestris]|nr:hypothetical protein CRUP_010984 [Coryphaenoides rupestris]